MKKKILFILRSGLDQHWKVRISIEKSRQNINIQPSHKCQNGSKKPLTFFLRTKRRSRCWCYCFWCDFVVLHFFFYFFYFFFLLNALIMQLEWETYRRWGSKKSCFVVFPQKWSGSALKSPDQHWKVQTEYQHTTFSQMSKWTQKTFTSFLGTKHQPWCWCCCLWVMLTSIVRHWLII